MAEEAMAASPSSPPSSSCARISSSSTPSMSMARPVFDLFDRLWFCENVLPLSSTSSRPPSPSADPSTLLAECMCSGPHRLPSFVPPDSSTMLQQFEQLPWPPSFTGHSGEDAYCKEEEDEAGGGGGGGGGDDGEGEEASCTEQGGEELDGNEEIPRFENDDAGQVPSSDHAAVSGLSSMEQVMWQEQWQGYESPQVLLPELESSEQEWGVGMLQDVSTLYKCPRSFTTSYGAYHLEAWVLLSALSNLQISAENEQADMKDMKEHLKLWAQAVASTVRQEC